MIVGNLSSIEVVDNIIVNVIVGVDVTYSCDILIEEAKEHERFADFHQADVLHYMAGHLFVA